MRPLRGGVASMGYGALALMLLAAACGSPAPTPEPTPTPTPEPPSQRVAYVTGNYAIFTAKQDGGGVQRLLGEEAGAASGEAGTDVADSRPRYAWPTWSPTGEHLAFSRVPGTARGSAAALMVLTMSNRRLEAAHNMTPGHIGLVVQNGPHYTQWSPDGRRLTFVVPDSNGLLVYMVTVTGLLVPQVLIDQAPVYFDWDRESSNLFIHRQTQLFQYSLADEQMTPIEERSALYRVPAIGPAGDRIAFLAERDGVTTLVVRTMATGEEEWLATAPRETAFIWSPTEQYIAITSRSGAVPAFYDGLDLINVDTGERRRLLDGLVLSFFWSPDGERLAVIRGLPDSISFEWSVVELASGDTRPLTTFLPSADMLSLLTFFDQFSTSHSPWAEDSMHLVFAGQVRTSTDASSTGAASIYVLDTSGDGTPQAIAEGNLAIWIPSAASHYFED